jgi:cytoskeletal protein CcmA (bactofilin family)
MRCVKNIHYIMLVLLLCLPSYGLVVRTGDDVTIGEGEVVDDDLVVFAQRVNVQGTVRGDIFAFAQNVDIGGTVSGTVFAGAADVEITTERVNSVWAAGSRVEICGRVDHNAIIAGGNLDVCDDARIGKELHAYGGQLDLSGAVAGMTKGGIGTFSMSGSSGGMQLEAGKVTLYSSARVYGDLVVESEEEPDIAEGAVITGETRFEMPEVSEEVEEAGSALVAAIAFFVAFMRIAIFVAKLVVGIILIAVSYGFVRRMMDTLIEKPWKSLGWGFLGLIVLPVAVVICVVVLIGFPLAVFGIYVYSIITYLASIVVGLVLGEKVIRLFKKKGAISPYLSFIVGIAILFVVSFVPILNVIITLLVMLFGAGALLLGSWQLCKDMRAKKLI